MILHINYWQGALELDVRFKLVLKSFLNHPPQPPPPLLLLEFCHTGRSRGAGGKDVEVISASALPIAKISFKRQKGIYPSNLTYVVRVNNGKAMWPDVINAFILFCGPKPFMAGKVANL